MTTDEELLAAAKETNKWLRILALPRLREDLMQLLDTPQKRKIYQNSDGRPIREVARDAEAGFGTVQRCWQEWAARGLMERAGTEGRFSRLVDLRDVGLEETHE